MIQGFAGMGLSFELTGLHALYGTIAVIMWAASALFSLEYLRKNCRHDSLMLNSRANSVQPPTRPARHGSKRLYYVSMLITFVATLGVFLSADLYTLFIFFEIMSFASYIWVVYEQDREAVRAAQTYLAVAVIGGLVMLMGIFMLYNLAGTLNIEELREYCSPVVAGAIQERLYRGKIGACFVGEAGRQYRDLFAAGLCLLFGFGAKAGAFPLHIWLPKAHPVAPAPMSALLSGILTKAGIFGIFILSCNVFACQGSEGEALSRVFASDELWGFIVLFAGAVTMVLGAVLAAFSINIKRTLACSSVSQIGFILTGIGMYSLLGGHGNIAVSGALFHAVNHSLFKLVLFLSAGAVFMNAHSLDLNEIRGFGRNKKSLGIAFALGSLGIMGVPGLSGYISKTLIHESIVEYAELLKEEKAVSSIFSVMDIRAIEWLFLISGGFTVAYMLKLFICVFVEKNTDALRQKEYDGMAGSYMTLISKAAILVPAAFFPVSGLFPKQTFERMALSCSSLLNTSELSVSYFSFENLKGSLISIAIGLLIYFFVIRGLLTGEEKAEELLYLGDMVIERQGENLSYMERVKPEKWGMLAYKDRWPSWLDLEELVYRPLLLKVLPAALGFVCRVLDSLVDTMVVALRRTVLKDSELPYELSEGTGFTNGLGRLADHIENVLNHTIWRRNPHQHIDHPHAYAMKHDEFMENEFIILRSMSFGLILFCLGLMVTIIYLLFR